MIEQDILHKLLEAVGVSGIFAVCGSIALMRIIRMRFYLTKRSAFIVAPIVSALVGAASVYFIDNHSDLKHVLGGAFITVIAVMVAYDILKAALAILYQKTKWEVFRVLFFFISPKPVRYSENGADVEVAPSETLTKFMDWRPEDEKLDFDVTGDTEE